MRRLGDRKKPIEPEQAADPAAARNEAVALLARRDFASAELLRKLAEKGFEPAVAAAVVAGLVEERTLNDARFAANFVAWHAGRGQGPIRIARELRELGLAEELVETVLAEGPDFRALAREVRRRKFGAEVPGSWAGKARQARFLQYRGFSADHIRSALGPDFDPDQ